MMHVGGNVSETHLHVHDWRRSTIDTLRTMVNDEVRPASFLPRALLFDYSTDSFVSPENWVYCKTSTLLLDQLALMDELASALVLARY